MQIPIWNYFAGIDRSLLEKIEQTLNRSITKFYNSDDKNATVAELQQIETRPTSS